MARTWSILGAAALVLVLGGWGVPFRAEGFEMLDDFEDGCSTDGVPASWPSSAWCLAGTQRVEDGKLVFGGAVDDFVGSAFPVALYGDVSVHFRATCDHLGQVSALINAVPGACDPRMYFAYAVYGSGNIGIGGDNVYFQTGVMAQPPQAGDVVEFKFDYTGGELQLRVWLPEKGETMPVEPLLGWYDSRFQSGVAGVYNIIRAAGGEMSYDFISIEATGEINEIFDDFEDGNPFDGTPGMWAVGVGTCGDGRWRCEDGRLIIGDVAGDMVGIWVPRDFPLVTSVRVEAQASDPGVFGLAMANRACGPYQVWGSLSFASANITVGHKLDWTDTYTDQDVLAQPPPLGENLSAQVDLTGTELWLRVWRPDEGEGLPDEPLLRAPETVFDGGAAGAYYWAPQPAGGEVALDSIYLMDQPRAALRVEPPGGTAPLEVTVDGSLSANGSESIREVVRHRWDFGDGSPAVEGVEATHTFADAGRYTIRLTVTDDYGASGTATRAIVVGCPAGDTGEWSFTDIGEPSLPGSAWIEGGDAGDIHICTAGKNISTRADCASFLYKEIAGDFRITARAASVENVGTGGSAGVMVRTSLDAGAITGAMVLHGPPRGTRRDVRFGCRSGGDYLMGNDMETLEVGESPVWVRLERRWVTLTASYSLDGEIWTPCGDAEAIPAGAVLVGVAACKGAATAASGPHALQAVFTDAALEEIPPLFFRRGDANDDGEADISDAIYALTWLYLGGAAPGCVVSADTNGDGLTDLSDAVYLLGHLFLGGPAPPPPFPGCGPGTVETDAVLGCLAAPVSCR